MSAGGGVCCLGRSSKPRYSRQATAAKESRGTSTATSGGVCWLGGSSKPRYKRAGKAATS